MNESTEKPVVPAQTSTRGAPVDYEAPRVERVLTQEQLDEEALYAGGQATPQEL
jgi:hypothetical protein